MVVDVVAWAGSGGVVMMIEGGPTMMCHRAHKQGYPA